VLLKRATPAEIAFRIYLSHRNIVFRAPLADADKSG
jgi:hypothetical protein